jgi:hypothetical protein
MTLGNHSKHSVQPFTPTRDEKFVRGPLPLLWLQEASRLGGKHTMATALALWHIVGLAKSLEIRANQSSIKNVWGFSRDSARRAMERLEKAGLIRINRKKGSVSGVTIIPRRHPDGRAKETQSKINLSEIKSTSAQRGPS